MDKPPKAVCGKIFVVKLGRLHPQPDTFTFFGREIFFKHTINYMMDLSKMQFDLRALLWHHDGRFGLKNFRKSQVFRGGLQPPQHTLGKFVYEVEGRIEATWG